ncbi:hypothetical protein CA236_07420 [Sphingomonas sp. ABOLG]|jgi:hypothetical protein|uniref:hypothetical protein n=1 Tax=Sphingomonas sp. ABOLG TaxID=1985880 RepID=UPI000F7F80B0|nr:hypothetical protein [Sphingomonas sp. ABOLG]RSV18435.1 hypothetical protein CA236_07420 [Sphingomonas sp. ABOLG]
MKRAALLLLALGGCEVAPDRGEVERVRAGTEAVRQQLREPESAQFKGVIAHGDAVCGEVNASVGMGRTGYERFIVKAGKVTLASQLRTDADMDARWKADCGG